MIFFRKILSQYIPLTSKGIDYFKVRLSSTHPSVQHKRATHFSPQNPSTQHKCVSSTQLRQFSTSVGSTQKTVSLTKMWPVWVFGCGTGGSVLN